MSLTDAGDLGDGTSGAVAEAPLLPGRTTVAHRVLVKVAEEAAATTIGVARSDLSVDVAESHAGLGLRISTPLPVPSLDETGAIRAGQPVMDRVAALQEELRTRIAHVTGSDVLRVHMTITGAAMNVRSRVK